MPTGYTAALIEGEANTYEFFSHIGRGMGFAIMQRDSGPGPVKHRVQSEYYAKAVSEANDNLADVENRTDADWDRLYLEYVASTQAYNEKSAAKALEITNRIGRARADLISVRDSAPASMSSTFDFALEQLQQTLEFDGRPYIRPIATRLLWQIEQVAKAKRRVAYANESLQGEIKRVNETNEMVDDFYATLELLKKRVDE